MKAALLFLLSLGSISPCLSQTPSVAGSATAKGACDIANVGSHDTLTIHCGIGEEQGKRMIEMLNKVLANQIDPALVMQKLDEILAQRQQSVQIANAPYGIANAGGTLINPQVNNIGYMRKVLTPDQLGQVTAFAKSLPADENTDQKLLTCEMGNANSCSVAGQLSSAFVSAGLDMGRFGYNQVMSGGQPPDSLEIIVHSNPYLHIGQPVSPNGLPPGAWDVANLLHGFGLSIEFSVDDGVSPDKFRILVGNYP